MFIQRDPIGLLGGSNVFAYAPNPVMWIDPLGLWEFMNGAEARVSAGEFSNIYHSSTSGHAEINGLNDLLQSGNMKGQDIVISDVNGKFRAGNKPVALCSNCRLGVFDILQQGEARSISFPEVRSNKIVGQITIMAEDFASVKAELMKLTGLSKRPRSDQSWDVLKKYSKCT